MWTNDPFGYGSTVSHLFHLADVNRTALQRIHHSVKDRLFRELLVPWVWQQPFGKCSFSVVFTRKSCRYWLEGRCADSLTAWCTLRHSEHVRSKSRRLLSIRLQTSYLELRLFRPAASANHRTERAGTVGL